MPRRVIIDLDAGSDDAHALLFLLYEQKIGNVKIEAITCVHGNTQVQNVAVNVLRILSAAKQLQIPVFIGSTNPLILREKPEVQEEYFHGKDGFGDVEHENPVEKNLIEKENAVLALNRIISKNPKELSLICIGPLTNIALAIKTFPDFKDQARDLYIMGGNYTGVGNATAAAEYNFHCDPEAAYIALECMNCPIIIMPIECCQSARSAFEWRFNVLGKIDNDVMKLMNKIEKVIWTKSKLKSWYPCDAYLVAAFLYPDEIIVQKSNHNVSVELAGYQTRGQVVLDHLKRKATNAVIIEKVNTENFQNLLFKAIEGI